MLQNIFSLIRSKVTLTVYEAKSQSSLEVGYKVSHDALN